MLFTTGASAHGSEPHFTPASTPQIRNSVRYVASKSQKEFLGDLKKVYGAVNKDAAEEALLDLEQKWGEQYPVVIRSWQENWERM